LQSENHTIERNLLFQDQAHFKAADGGGVHETLLLQAALLPGAEAEDGIWGDAESRAAQLAEQVQERPAEWDPFGGERTEEMMIEAMREQ